MYQHALPCLAVLTPLFTITCLIQAVEILGYQVLLSHARSFVYFRAREATVVPHPNDTKEHQKVPTLPDSINLEVEQMQRRD